MLFIENFRSQPYYNIAAEEYLLKNFTQNIVMLYRNQPSLICGKHQNVFAEVNHNLLFAGEIPVVRRLSGGGTVYHDLGNLNFTFLLNGEEGKLVNFRQYAQPIIDFLRSIGAPAEFSERNDITIAGKKVSGNAEHIYKNRVLHHGTLLFNTNLENLENAITVNRRFDDKGIRSVRSKVTNISKHLPAKISFNEFKTKLFEFLYQQLGGTETYHFNATDVEAIKKLEAEKYRTVEWNYDYSPKFSFKRVFFIENEIVKLEIYVEKGIMVNLIPFDNQVENEKFFDLKNKLSGQRISTELLQ
ncbi:MAG TPA: lipoate--protein ligase [Bacteroidales bacterium]|nr:lipoate--protein ligase [Bacteroidales bacterium]